MARHKKVGRPKGKKSKPKSAGCRKIKIYHKVKGAVRAVKGVRRKSCLIKK